MITARTVAALQAAFEQAVHENSGAGQTRVSVTHGATPAQQDRTGHQLLVLTIAAQDFRIVVLFDFLPDTTTGNWFASLFHKTESCIEGQTLTDALAEYVNMVCGTANRLISTDSRRTGMSTPFVLEAGCRAHLPRIQPEHTLNLQIQAAAGMHYELLLCLCSASAISVDFDIDLRAQEETIGGELELF